jgi:hypothetical protein
MQAVTPSVGAFFLLMILLTDIIDRTSSAHFSSGHFTHSSVLLFHFYATLIFLTSAECQPLCGHT